MHEPAPAHLGVAVPPRLRVDDGELRLMTTLTSFATAMDVTLAELRLEALLAADRALADALHRRARERDDAGVEAPAWLRGWGSNPRQTD